MHPLEEVQVAGEQLDPALRRAARDRDRRLHPGGRGESGRRDHAPDVVEVVGVEVEQRDPAPEQAGGVVGGQRGGLTGADRQHPLPGFVGIELDLGGIGHGRSSSARPSVRCGAEPYPRSGAGRSGRAPRRHGTVTGWVRERDLTTIPEEGP